MIAADLAAAFETVPPVWRRELRHWSRADEQALAERARRVSADRPIAPADPFRALRLVAPAQVRVVIVGQDPYPGEGHADGLAFSAGRGRPRSLARVFEILAADRPGWRPPRQGRLVRWAQQGVLLLNPALTVEVGRAGSHLQIGWQALTSEMVSILCQRINPPAFLLWGGKAQEFFDRARPPDQHPPVWRTRHPAYDFDRRFMADGSHFLATADRVDWWAL